MNVFFLVLIAAMAATILGTHPSDAQNLGYTQQQPYSRPIAEPTPRSRCFSECAVAWKSCYDAKNNVESCRREDRICLSLCHQLE